MATDLARRNVDVIVAVTTFAALAAKRATTAIPIVTINADPLGSGLVSSLAARAAMSPVRRVAVIRHSAFGVDALGARPMQAAADTLGVSLSWLPAGPSGDYPTVIGAAAREAATGLLVNVGTNPVDDVHASRIVELAAQHRMPAPNPRALARRAADHVDRILNGAKPADLPVE